MIIDIAKFIETEKPYWQSLEKILSRMEQDHGASLSLEESRHLHYLYRRASSDLGKVGTFSSEPLTRHYLEALVARAHSEINEQRDTATKFSLLEFFRFTFPQTFRRQVNAFWIALILTVVGSLFGGAALYFDPASKESLVPFDHLLGNPTERVKLEEASNRSENAAHGTFSAYLMTHNTQVSITTFALGLTYGVGTIIMLFYNGVMLGSIIVDYVAHGQSVFLAGWLLPHGSVEIPCILIAGQAGLVLASALIGWGKRIPLSSRLRLIGKDLFVLMTGVALFLVWAGIVESFFSQYHYPVVPYSVKILFGSSQLGALVFYLYAAGRKREKEAN
ncbi:MAG: hypothetical protein JWN25_3239 [Verrucomicrobiales bacterium]|nr:hypothetical protein [Verrucomicrobiales bacterium]MDB6129161.1 hypothetical protein [Verrucomicrobiales bacterium]